MTLTASLATLMDLGRAYWVHKYDSNWIAKICWNTGDEKPSQRLKKQLWETLGRHCVTRGGFKWREKQVKIKTAGWLHLFLQLGLGQQLWNKVQADMDGGDPCYSQRQQSWIVTLPRERSQQKPAHVLESNHDSVSPTTSFQLCCLEGTWNQPSTRLTTHWQRNSGSYICRWCNHLKNQQRYSNRFIHVLLKLSCCGFYRVFQYCVDVRQH